MGRITSEGDDVGDAGIGEKVGMEPGEPGVGQKGEGEFARRATAKKFSGVGVERADKRDGRAAIGAQPGMAVMNGDDAHFQKNQEPGAQAAKGCNYLASDIWLLCSGFPSPAG